MYGPPHKPRRGQSGQHARRAVDPLRAPGIILILTALAVGGCERSYWDPTVKIGPPKGHVVDDRSQRRIGGTTSGGAVTSGIDLSAGAGVPQARDSVKRGTGTFVRKITPATVSAAPGDITLNFDGTDIREVVKVILNDLLQVSYILHPSVQGVASLKTGRPLRRDLLLPTLETLLRMNNAAMIYKVGTYEIVPLTNAVKGNLVPQLGSSSRALPNGYTVQVIPLQYVGAEEMSKILQPLAPEGSVIRTDSLRNLLVLAGTSPQMGNLLDTIQVFDVDWMAGLSVGFFTLEYARATDVVSQLENLLTDEGGNPFKGVFRFIPVESANSLLVISPQEKYLRQAKSWIERLDLAEASGDAAMRLFVYRVRNGDAENLADVLSKLFAGDSGGGRSRSVGGVAPGLQQGSIESGGGEGGGQPARRQASASTLQLASEVSIVADAVNNSLLIKSSPRDYKKILGALKQLDIVPLQVLVEATIVEIRLTGNLEYGVQWQFKGPAVDSYQARWSLDGTLDDATTSGISEAAAFPGFNWTVIARPDQIRATLSALAGDNLVNVLSSPSVMVMDNQTATIQVGQEVPIATSQQQGTSTTDRVVNTIEYRDTGVMLSVKPRVTPGGLVQMEIEQEVSTVASTESSLLNSPTFQTRNITSSVAVRSNQAVVLGGLIQDIREDGKQGLPGLYSLPVIGALFGERRKQSDRTELVVVLTPRVIASDQDVEAVTSDFRSRLKGLDYRF